VARACRHAIRSLLSSKWQPGDVLPFELVLAVNKMDALPRVVSYSRIEKLLRKRMQQARMPTPRQVHLVSCVRNIGVGKLLDDLVDLVCPCLSCFSSPEQWVMHVICNIEHEPSYSSNGQTHAHVRCVGACEHVSMHRVPGVQNEVMPNLSGLST
jgi:hypothetical protein